MKNDRLFLNLSRAAIAFAVLACVAGCSYIGQGLRVSKEQDLSLTGTPAIFFAYPHETPVIKDQAKVATVVYNNLYEVFKVDDLIVDNLTIFEKRGPKNMRATVRNSDGYTVAIDVLPGKHKFEISYDENIWIEEGKLYTRHWTQKHVELEADLKAGSFYQIRAMIINGNFMGLAIDKGLSDDSYAQKIIEERNKAPY